MALVETDRYKGQRLALVGPEPVTLKRYLSELRHLMGLGPGRFVHTPSSLVDFAAHVGKWTGKGMLDVETWQMLQRGNIADCRITRELLGHKPRPINKFAYRDEAKNLRLAALLGWLQFVLRLSIAAVWFVAGIVSMGIYPVEASSSARGFELQWALAPFALYGASCHLYPFVLGLYS